MEMFICHTVNYNLQSPAYAIPFQGRMTNNSQSSPSIQNIIAIMIIVAVICLTAIVIKPGILPKNPKPTPTAIQPTSSPSDLYQPEIIPLPTDMPGPTQTATGVPTNTPYPTPTLFLSPTIAFDSQPLPDLIVSGLSEPVCATEYEGDRTILRFSIFVRNIGRASTRYFGVFDTGVFLILGERHYSLDEWATEFNGVVGSSVTEVFNLNPDQDIKFTVVIDLIGNKDFGIEVIANSGENPIREADTTNNTLMKYFSVYCY
jgi:hypothetical protein